MNLSDISIERQFTIKSNFDAHVNKIEQLLLTDYPELLTIAEVPGEGFDSKGLSLEIFQTILTYFKTSNSREEFASNMTTFASIPVLTGVTTAERSMGFFTEAIKTVKSCLDTVKSLTTNEALTDKTEA